MSDVQRTDYIAGYFDPAELAANYQCGHCTSDTEITTGDHGGLRLVLPDAQRAASAPDAFRL